MSAHLILRSATRDGHDAVDAAFGGFDLTQPASYAAFLLAHARALPAIEAVLAADGSLPPWRPRRDALAGDLAALGRDMPPPLSFSPRPARTARLGMLYVIEGSRLGGDLLSRRVGAGLPAAYLGQRHLPGEWRALLGILDAEAEDGTAEMVAGAMQAFDLYRRAATDY